MGVLALTGIVVAAILYHLGTRRLEGRRSRRERPWRAQSFYAGLVALAVAIAPPLDGLADRLFWAHMVQHALLQMVAPPLIVLGAPWLVLWRPLSLGGRRRTSRWLLHSRGAAPLRAAARVLTVPAVAWVLFVGAIWLSHLPAVFDYAAGHALFHEAEHFVFFALGLLFWSRVLDSPPFHARLISLATARVPLRRRGSGERARRRHPRRARPDLHGLRGHRAATRAADRIADQQLGGAIMLEPASIPLLLAILWSIGTLIGPPARRAPESAA